LFFTLLLQGEDVVQAPIAMQMHAQRWWDAQHAAARRNNFRWFTPLKAAVHTFPVLQLFLLAVRHHSSSFIHFFIATNVKRIRRYIGYD